MGLRPLVYRCPNCEHALPRWQVRSAGPLDVRRCDQCGVGYFGGGPALAMWLLCLSAYVGMLSMSLTGKLNLVWICPSLGAIAALALMWNALPVRATRRWTESVKALAAPAALWALFMMTEAIATWLSTR